MRLKNFILALVAMLWSFSFSVAAQTDVVVVYNEAQLREALAADGVHGARLLRSAAQSEEPQHISFGGDVVLTAPFQTNAGGNFVLDLEGYALRGAAIDGTKHQYPFYNRGTLIIKDSKGGGYIDCGVYNGYDTDGVTYSEARLEMLSGKIVCHDDEGAAIINYGTTIISGGSVEGSVNALKNVSGTMTVADGVSITGEVAGEVTISTGVKFTVAKIGDNVYATFGEALTAAKAMSGEVTVQIYGEVEFVDGMELDGANYTTINFVGKSAKAKMTVNQTAGGDYLTAHDKTVNFTDLTLTKANPAWSGNSGHMGNYFSIQGGTVTYTNCTFLNGACANTGTAVFNDCTFQNASEYGLWVYDDALVTVNGGTIDSKKGIKVYSEGEESVTSTLTVKNATFTENVTGKPAVAIGYAESITLIGNTYNNTTGVLELDSSSDADCEGVTFVAQDENGTDISSTITAVYRSNGAPCGVLVDGKIYTAVTEAAKEATETSTVTLLHSSDEVVEFPLGTTINYNNFDAPNVTNAKPFADYVVLPASMTVNNYKAMFGDNTVTDGTNYYATLQAAVEAVVGKANAVLYCKPGADVGSLQHAPVTSTLTVYGNNANVTGDTERDFDLGNTDPNGGKDITADMTLTVKHLNGCGAWGAKATEHTVNLVFENCDNMGKVLITGTTGTLNITMTDCAFEGVIKEAVYSNADGAITLTNVAFSNLNKGVNLNHKAAGTQTVTIDGCSFTNCGADVAKDEIPVRVLSSVSSGKSVLAVNNTTFTGTPVGGADILLVDGEGVTEAKVTNTAANVKPGENAEMVAVNAQDSYEYNNIVAKIGDVEYASLQAAIDAVKNADEVILVADCDEAITFTQTKDVSFVLNGNDKTMTGSINITARAGLDAPSTLVIKNFNFETDKISHDFIKSVETNYYPNNITIQDCTFKGTSDINTEGYAVVAVRLKSANNITIKDCTGTGLHSFLQNTAGWNVTIDKVEITNSLSGFAMGTVQGTAIKNCDITVEESGIRLDAQYNNNAVIADNEINAFIPVVVRKASVDGNITFSGANNFTATNTDRLWCAIGTSEYKENGALPTDATGRVKVTLNDTGLNAEGIYGNFVPTAKIGEAEYATLADAIAAVKNGETITLVAGVEEDVTVVQAPDVAFTIDGKDNTFKGTITVDGKSAAYATAGVTIKNVNFVAATDAVCINLGVSGNSNTRYTSNVTVDGCTFTGTDCTAVGIKSYTGGDKNLTVTNCTATKMHSLMQLKNVAGVNVANCTIEESKNGIALGASSNVAVTETKMDVDGYGVRADASVATNATITDCNITAFIPVVVRNASADYNLTFAGDNTMTPENTDHLWCAIGTKEYEENGTMPTAATGKVKVILNEEDTDLDIAGVYGNFGVASIGNVNYMTFAAALDAVEDGETITLAENAIGDEKSKEIEFTKGINFTITGKAPQYALPVITFQNATVNIKDAEILIPELDARQNATIYVINSTVRDAGGNSIAKSYYNGAINIDANSTVHMMQVTTMGYINVAGTLNATWQTNVYGNGIITLAEGAKFNTAALHLTGQDYSGRDNTDADRVGKPATIVVDGANLNIGKVLSAGGADYSYNSSKGINVGTIDGKSAVLDIKNGANVDIYMANGETANFGAGATVNVEASTLNVLCRAGDGVATLANAGTVNVSGESNLDIKNFSGNAIAVTGATLKDLQFGGPINAFGTNNISGTSKIGGILGLGYKTNPTGKVEVNITGNFNGTNVIVNTNNNVDNILNVGAADGDRTTAHFGQLGAFGDVNINNADVTYGYTFIINDFKATNSKFEIKGGVNTYFSGNAKVVLDESTWNLSGYANIGSYGGYMYGNADVTLKNGSSMTATNLGIELQEGKEVKLTLEGTSSLTATKLSNQGSIVLASTEATITANSGVSNITTPIEDHKIGYVDGAYKVVAKDYVAYIGEQGYESLAEALTAAADGETVLLSWVEGDPAIAMNGAVFGKSVTITGNANVDWSKGWFFVGRGGEGNATVTFDNANLTSASINSNSGLGIHVSGREKDTDNKYDGTLVIKNSTVALDYLINRGAITVDGAILTVKNGFGIAGRPASETESGADATATITLENNAKLVVNNHNGMGLGQAATKLEGYGVMNVNLGSTFETTQAFNVSAKGQMNVNGGTVKITGNLANNGTVYVAGASTLDAAVTGDGWFYMNGVTLGGDTKLNGAKVAFINGENTVKGSTIKDGFFSVGIGKDAEAEKAAAFAQANGITLGDVTVNVSVNANIGGNGETYSGWVGSAYSADKTQHKYVLNVENSLAAFGYMHVSKDGTFTVYGRSADGNKYTFDNANVNFYAGDFIINGVVALNSADAWVKFTKMSVDHVGGVLNINGDTKYESSIHNGSNTGTSLVYYNSGEVNVAETAIVEIDNATNFVDDAVLNIAGNVTAKGAITGNGAISFTNDAATLTTATTGLTIGYSIDPDKKVVYADGAYKVVSKVYVAKTDDAKYESLAAAVAAVEDGDTITLIADETFTENNRDNNGGWWDGLAYSGDKSFTIDLATFTISQDGALNDYLMWFKNDGAKANTITLKNGTLDAGTTAYCALATASSNAQKITVNLENINVINNNSNGATLKIRAGAELNVKAGTEITGKDSYLGIECWAATVNIYEGAKINMNGTSSYCGCLVGASGNGTVNVYGGKGKSASGGFIAMTSGGTINVAGGEWIANTDGTYANNNKSVLVAQSDKQNYDGAGNSIVNVTGGTFKGGYNCYGNAAGDAQINISGGNFNADPAKYLAQNYVAVENNGVWNVVKPAVKVGDTCYASLEAGLKALTDGATLTFLEDITVTEAWDCRDNGAKVTAANVTIDGNGKTLKIAGAVDDRNWNTVFRFEGDNATVKNLTIDASAATGIDRGITSKLSVTVDSCTLVGNGTSANRAIIFGEGAGSDIDNVIATVTNSTFKNWNYGVTDNQNAQDAKNVTVIGNIFENASVLISASSKVVFSNNSLADGGVSITSYTNVEGVSVQAFNNTLDTDEINKITTNPARHMISGEGFSTPVAKMDGKYYVSIQDAVDSSTATGSEIILTVNRYLDMDEAVVIEGKVVTLNLNGKIVRATAEAKMTGGIFRLLDGADLTIRGEGEINYNGNANVYTAVGVLGAANLTVENSNLVGYYYGIAGNGMKDGFTITINGGIISSVEGTGSGIYHPQNGTLNVNGGTVAGATGIYFKSGVLNITGGTIKGTGAKVEYAYNGNGSDATGDALVIENVAAGNYEAVTSVSITGGTFDSNNAAPIASYGENRLVEFIGDGCQAQFSNNNIDESLLVVGYQLSTTANANGCYSVVLTMKRESMTIDESDYTEFVNETDIKVGTLTYQRRLEKEKVWLALYVPFEIPVAMLTEKGYDVVYFNDFRETFDSNGQIIDGKSVIEMVKITSGTLKANYPYAIKANNSEALDMEIVLNDVKLYSTVGKREYVECSSATKRFTFYGTYKKGTKKDLTGSDDVLVYALNYKTENMAQMTPTAMLGAFRIYMTVTKKNGEPFYGSDVHPARSISLHVIGEENENGETIIYDVVGSEQKSEAIFDLQGRRVLSPVKGNLYIINGKKVVY